MISVAEVLEVAHHEACVREMYKDSVGTGTWGFGLTAASGVDPEAFKGKPADMQSCIEIFISVLEIYAGQVDRAFSGVRLLPHERAAAISFHWNTGAINRATWVKRFLAGDVHGAEEAFLWYNKPKEIIDRRRAEARLFFHGVYCSDGYTTVYERVNPIRGTPVWSSAKRVRVREDVEAALIKKGRRPINSRALPLVFTAACAAILSFFEELQAIFKSIFGG
ncbi:lysozyme [Polycladidibacter hongkongensis]|uniref:lysozyme n=1 Tax=Polycladidibacter hongkongensis TaxID=1647556 RepID=UPI000A5D8C0D|nr:hypothetical protein [Pseudovibrio hongkongensis]